MNKAKILIVDDDQNLREAIADTLKLAGYSCIEAVNGLDALAKLAVTEIDMVISDVQMEGMDGHALLNNINNMYPRLPVLLSTAYANINGAIRAMREGAVDYLAKPFAPEVLLNQVGRYVPSYQVETKEPVYGDPKTGQLFALVVKVARSDASVMITGPSGSGKEVLSRYIHDHSPRASKPFVAINCAAIPESMLEATLFGYEKGAFTGAVQACPGKFEQAQDGTILLDEITEMDLNLQAKLLRVLQEKEVERLGGRKTIPLNVRVLATSNRNLKEAVAKGLFREDLYYRLNVFPLAWLPLKDRRGDIIPLAEHLLALHAKEQGRKIPVLSDDAKQTLLNYDFPGNVRELDNLVQRALILSDEEVVSENLLPLEHKGNGAGGTQELLHSLFVIIVQTEALWLLYISIEAGGIYLFLKGRQLVEIQLIHDSIEPFTAEDSPGTLCGGFEVKNIALKLGGPYIYSGIKVAEIQQDGVQRPYR